MSAFSGRQYKGAKREHREQKRLQAELRNAATPAERRRAYRRTIRAVEHILTGAP